ncbi:MAG TPA: hypothetical protein VNF73_09725, partial [Candidatus Saccharimonadales bacterium]|nr:hypothetical protein [Candidatus Saccharimonadales bacterium]
MTDEGRGLEHELGGSHGRSHLSPEAFRTIVSYVLAIGVTVSAAVIALGFLLAIVFGWQTS